MYDVFGQWMPNKIMDNTLKNQPLQYSKGTISVSLVHEALQEAKNQGITLDPILDQAGIASEILHSPLARVSVEAYAQLWTELANAMNDEFFGMDRHHMRRGSYKLLSEMVMHADQLHTALRQILQFLNAILDDFQSTLFTEENYAYIVIYDTDQPKRMFSYATYLMLIHGLMCWLTGQRITLNRIELKCNAPQDDQDYKVRFCENIGYLADENYIQFDASWLKTPIKQDHSTWQKFIQNTPQNLLVRFKNPHALSSIIRKHLMQKHPSKWLELNELTQFLNISEATIQRRLKSEGFSYQQLKNEIRRDTAIELLSRSDKTLQQISDDLYFQDPSAFHRAFKKWTGVSPGSYRHENITLDGQE